MNSTLFVKFHRMFYVVHLFFKFNRKYVEKITEVKQPIRIETRFVCHLVFVKIQKQIKTSLWSHCCGTLFKNHFPFLIFLNCCQTEICSEITLHLFLCATYNQSRRKV